MNFSKLSQLTTDSLGAELKDIVDSAKSLAGLESDDQASQQANIILGRLFAAIHKLNYLVQSQLADKLVEAPTTTANTSTVSPPQTIGSGAIIPSAGSDILNEFDSWIQTIKQALAQIAKFLKASQYSIGVQFPFSVSVSITFTP